MKPVATGGVVEIDRLAPKGSSSSSATTTISSSVEVHVDDGRIARNKPLVGRDGPQASQEWLTDPVAFVSQILLRVQQEQEEEVGRGGGPKRTRRCSRAPPATRNFPQSVRS